MDNKPRTNVTNGVVRFINDDGDIYNVVHQYDRKFGFLNQYYEKLDTTTT